MRRSFSYLELLKLEFHIGLNYAREFIIVSFLQEFF